MNHTELGSDLKKKLIVRKSAAIHSGQKVPTKPPILWRPPYITYPHCFRFVRRNLVRAATSYVFYASRNQIYRSFDTKGVFPGALWFDITHTEKSTQDTQGPIDWPHIYKYILTPPATSTTCITLNEYTSDTHRER